jgi:hypothetical protein
MFVYRVLFDFEFPSPRFTSRAQVAVWNASWKLTLVLDTFIVVRPFFSAQNTSVFYDGCPGEEVERKRLQVDAPLDRGR